MANFELPREERVAPAPEPGGRVAAPALVRPSGVWLAVLLKGLGIFVLMLSLAAIGGASMIYGAAKPAAFTNPTEERHPIVRRAPASRPTAK